MTKIEEELKEFKEFKNNYSFIQKEIYEIDNNLYCDDISLIDEFGETIGESDNWYNIGYNVKGPYSKILSNLFPYRFIFRNKELSSIESFFQGIKFKDKIMQDYVFEYSGKEAIYVKNISDNNWLETKKLYWQGEEINRFSEEYESIVDELYISAIQNPLYRNALKKCDKYI